MTEYLNYETSDYSEYDSEEEIPEELIKVPEELIGPISYQLLEDPVTASDGFTYERKRIVQWFKKCGSTPKSPMTNKVLTSTRVEDDLAMKEKIAVFKKQRLEFVQILQKSFETESCENSKTKEDSNQESTDDPNSKIDDKEQQSQTNSNSGRVFNCASETTNQLQLLDRIISKSKQEFFEENKLSLQQQTQPKLVNSFLSELQLQSTKLKPIQKNNPKTLFSTLLSQNKPTSLRKLPLKKDEKKEQNEDLSKLSEEEQLQRVLELSKTDYKNSFEEDEELLKAISLSLDPLYQETSQINNYNNNKSYNNYYSNTNSSNNNYYNRNNYNRQQNNQVSEEEQLLLVLELSKFEK
ncbi:wd repeat [Anaeramoeba flamelloides]|uniref:Wd repeat n=1 Tax=Anaeramoeba flamelloides TaxID=1746091 RepID=A0ABQ8XH20_9EUKA|nr:wd repeat [Anaeramoeba flamelloides]